MTEISRWSIEELQARYSLEPELNDIFVEGQYDKEILSLVFANSPRRETFYEIDVVEVPSSLLNELNLTSGNKQRVIALAHKFEHLESTCKVRCLVDRDMDHWFDQAIETRRLKWSLFCSIESHFITKELIRDIVIITAGARVDDFDSLSESLLLTLRQLYSLRLADKSLDLNLRWLPTKKYFSRNEQRVIFDKERYVSAVLDCNSQRRRQSEFWKATEKWQDVFQCDVRLAAHGHDYTKLLAWVIKEFRGHRSFDEDGAIERLFVLLSQKVPSFSEELR